MVKNNQEEEEEGFVDNCFKLLPFRSRKIGRWSADGTHDEGMLMRIAASSHNYASVCLDLSNKLELQITSSVIINYICQGPLGQLL